MQQLCQHEHGRSKTWRDAAEQKIIIGHKSIDIFSLRHETEPVARWLYRTKYCTVVHHEPRIWRFSMSAGPSVPFIPPGLPFGRLANGSVVFQSHFSAFQTRSGEILHALR